MMDENLDMLRYDRNRPLLPPEELPRIGRLLIDTLSKLGLTSSEVVARFQELAASQTRKD